MPRVDSILGYEHPSIYRFCAKTKARHPSRDVSLATLKPCDQGLRDEQYWRQAIEKVGGSRTWGLVWNLKKTIFSSRSLRPPANCGLARRTRLGGATPRAALPSGGRIPVVFQCAFCFLDGRHNEEAVSIEWSRVSE